MDKALELAIKNQDSRYEYVKSLNSKLRDEITQKPLNSNPFFKRYL